MKRCPQCKRTKALGIFAVATRRKDGRQSTCKECKRKWDSQLYEPNPRKYAGRNADRRALLKRLVVEYDLQAHLMGNHPEGDR